MKKFIIYLLVTLSFLVFIVLTIHRNKGFNDNWKNKITFEGVVQDVVHIENEKGSFLKINDKWYDFSYNRTFEEQKFIGFKIEKRINEEGVWIEKNKGSDNLLFYWGRGNIVKDSMKLNILNQKCKVLN
ncbi:MAG: hypothetical protein RBS07_15360 [Lentimicrobium sp.]|jgi:hypothetical protein|nr:hypothetical protein [Lentimicrobium sp.]